MSFSMNEVEAMTRKAIRGAGYEWGYAQEGAKAVRWLCNHGIDGCGSLERLLQHFDSDIPVLLPSDLQTDSWSAPDGMLCPLVAGAAYSDRAAILNGREIKLNQVVEPILLAYYAAIAARQTDTIICLQWFDTALATDGYVLSVDTEYRSENEGLVLISRVAGGELGLPTTHCTRVTPPYSWARLNKFAHRTYAPATEESRNSGAGSGLTDND